eukprot:GHVS01050235.1.p1 GENE.GHVS01050235.1~~GHVS01050235.1.p1  ORF type:complete len:260 (-),score=45.92 GHVS01050235.1:88-867(-)
MSVAALSGRHVLVTGATRGIGLGLSRQCLLRGAARVTITARNAPPSNLLTDMSKDVTCHKDNTVVAGGAVVRYVPMDVGDRDSVQKAFLTATSGGSQPVDVLICAAGVTHSALVEEETGGFHMINVNLVGSWLCVQQVLPSMKERNYGGIILIGSEAGLIGIYGYGAYCASKFGLRGLAEALYMETAGHDNIRTCLVLPPAVDTPGLHEENKDKLELTRLIEDVGGLLTVEQVAIKTMDAFEKGWGVKQDKPNCVCVYV